MSQRVRAAGLIAIDALAWFAGIGLGVAARLDFELDRVRWGDLAIAAGAAVAVQMAYGAVAGLYTGRWRSGSFEEAGVLAGGAAAIGIAMLLLIGSAGGERLIPLSTTITGAAFFVVFALGARYVIRIARNLRRISRHERAHRVLVFGAGEGGYEAARALLEDPKSDLLPVAFLDDDRTKHRLRILGRRVVGGREAIPEAARDFRADTVVLAFPSASRTEVSSVARIARETGLRVLILPRMALLLETHVSSADIRPLELADFLGRREVALDLGAIAHIIRGRRVLVTGAGGSIGSELCAVIQRYHPEQLFMLDRDESALHAVQLRLEGRALLDGEAVQLADIRDVDKLNRVFAELRPHVVFHAAALKHVTFLERFPAEGVKTNVLGTRNVLEAAAAAGVERFVNVSTDKAADPINVLGATKRVAEMLTSAYGRTGSMVCVSVRFGNVLGSRGSVIPTLRKQIADGGPLTITHPEVTRYFMTIEEAVQLVVQAGAVGRSSEVIVLDMGEPVRILDLAAELVAELSPGSDIAVEFTGLRPGEKLHEVLFAGTEVVVRRPHEMLQACVVPPIEPGVVAKLDGLLGAEARARLFSMLAEV